MANLSSLSNAKVAWRKRIVADRHRGKRFKPGIRIVGLFSSRSRSWLAMRFRPKDESREEDTRESVMNDTGGRWQEEQSREGGRSKGE